MKNKELLEDVLNKLYLIEDKLSYRNKKISNIINLIQEIKLRS